MRVVSRTGIPRIVGSRRISGSSVPPRMSPSMPLRAFSASAIAVSRPRVSGRKTPLTSSFMYFSRPDSAGQILDEALVIPRFDQIDNPLQVDAVDEDRRVASVPPAFAIRRDHQTVR